MKVMKYKKPNLDDRLLPSVNQVYAVVNEEEPHTGVAVDVHKKQETRAFLM